MANLSATAAIKQVLQLPIFGGLSAATRKHLKGVMRVDHLAAGTCFLIEGDPSADDLFVVLRGEVALTFEDKLLVLNGPPDLIGLLSVIDGAPRTASATAFSDVALAVLPREDFRSLMAISPRFARNVIEHLTRDVRNLHSADEKVWF